MSYEFKNLSDVEPQDKPTENTTVMAFENGVPKQIPAGEFGGKGYMLKPTMDEIIEDVSSGRTIITTNYDNLLKVLERGGLVWVVFPKEYEEVSYLTPQLVYSWRYLPKDIAQSKYGFDSAVVRSETYDYLIYLTNGSYVPNL